MYQFRKSLIGLIGVLTLLAIATIGRPHTGLGASGSDIRAAAAQTQNVNVVNTPTVQVGNFPVTTNVAVTGTPTVGLDAGNNTVKIDTSNPVLVRDVDNPARQPFEGSTSLVVVFGQTQALGHFITVPAGKVLIVEHVSADALLAGNDRLVSLAIYGNGISHYVVPNDAGMDNIGRHRFSVSQQVRFYFTEGVQVSCFAERADTNSQPGINVSLFGYFVDKP